MKKETHFGLPYQKSFQSQLQRLPVSLFALVFGESLLAEVEMGHHFLPMRRIRLMLINYGSPLIDAHLQSTEKERLSWEMRTREKEKNFFFAPFWFWVNSSIKLMRMPFFLLTFQRLLCIYQILLNDTNSRVKPIVFIPFLKTLCIITNGFLMGTNHPHWGYPLKA